MTQQRSTPAVGRPAVTTHDRIEKAAFTLFTSQGFERTTLDDIAAEVGVARRTLFRYFDSKNDIPWGQFDRSLIDFAQILRSHDPGLRLGEVIYRSVRAFNDFPETVLDQHRERMQLILRTPSLQAHSALKYRAWRDVIATFAAERLKTPPGSAVPHTLGHISLALSLAAYDEWLTNTGTTLGDCIRNSFAAMQAMIVEDLDPR